MCGICGFTEPVAAARIGGDIDRRKTVEDMSAVMYHRGPDGHGSLVADGIAFGHRRLSLVDLESGAQPMSRGPNPSDAARTDEDGMLAHLSQGGAAIVFNGEIYNHAALREELEGDGWSFSTRSDTEVLLACWQKWGKGCLSRLRGMFAFAVWEPDKDIMTLARDPFGIKPLYWTRDADGALVFASEAKCLFEHPRVEKRLDRGQLVHYLSFQYSVGERTFFQGVRKLAPGTLLEWRQCGGASETADARPTIANDDTESAVAGGSVLPRNLTIERYWKADYDIDPMLGNDVAADRIEHAFDDSVSHHRFADVEVGMLLSGGVDSTYVASSLSEKQRRVRAFTVGFAETDADAKGEGKTSAGRGEAHRYTEIDEAQETSSAIGTAHDTEIVSADEYWDAIPKIQWHMDEPSADPAAVALFFADRLAARKVKAVMSGEGADELFGGYQIYNTAVSSKRLSWLPKPIAAKLADFADRHALRGANYLRRVAYGPQGTFIGNAYLFGGEERMEILSDDMKAIAEGEASPQEAVAPLYDDIGYAPDDALRMQYVDINTWLSGDILQKTDRMSMAHSLEARVPFLDAEVWKVARTLPIGCRLDGDKTKIALRRAAERSVPEGGAARPKLGFPVPMRVWLKEEKWQQRVRDAFHSKAAMEFFEPDALDDLLSRHASGASDESRKIWAVYSFLVWHAVYFEGEGVRFSDAARLAARAGDREWRESEA